MCFAISCFFLAFPKNAQKNNAREVAKISLAFSLAFILQIQPGLRAGSLLSARFLQRANGRRTLPIFALLCEKGLSFWTDFDYNKKDIIQI